MQDRYLYRAKRIDNGVWVEGNLIHAKKDYYICENPYECMNEYSSLNGQSYGFGGFKFVDPSTICQCTGLKDKNGKLIWENDIVKEFNSSGDEWNLSQIVFGEYSLNLGWCTKGIKTLHEYNRRLFNVGFGTSEAGKCEVIGNIFDNPELLE